MTPAGSQRRLVERLRAGAARRDCFRWIAQGPFLALVGRRKERAHRCGDRTGGRECDVLRRAVR